NPRIMFLDPQGGCVVAPILTRDGVAGVEQSDGSAQNLLVGQHTGANGGFSASCFLPEVLSVSTLDKSGGEAPAEDGQPHRKQEDAARRCHSAAKGGLLRAKECC